MRRGQLVPRNAHLSSGSNAVKLAQRYVAVRLIGARLLIAFAIREIRCALGDARSPMRAALIANACTCAQRRSSSAPPRRHGRHSRRSWHGIEACFWSACSGRTASALVLDARDLNALCKPVAVGVERS